MPLPDAPRSQPDWNSLQLLVLDVDDVLTDGSLFVTDDGVASKRFSILDGAGLVYWKRAGFDVAIISGHSAPSTVSRMLTLGITDVQIGVKDKLAAFTEVIGRRGIGPERCAVMGDDLMDLPLLRRAGFAAVPPIAHDSCKRLAHYVTTTAAGSGAVREVVELLLSRKGLWDGIVESYLK